MSLANLIRTTTYDSWKTTDTREGTPNDEGTRCTQCGARGAGRFPRAGIALCRDCSPKWDAEQQEIAAAAAALPPIEVLDAQAEAEAPAKGGRLASGHERVFLLGGRAVLTLVSRRTGVRFTFRVVAAKEGDARHFVSVLTGPENTRDYSFLGTIFEGRRYAHGRKSEIGQDAPSAKAFAWFAERVLAGRSVDGAEVWHEGRCGRCARPLTDPESIASGLGPICGGR